MAGDAFCDVCLGGRRSDSSLDNCFVQMVATFAACWLMDVLASGREDPLPDEVATGIGILALEVVGERYPSGSLFQVGLVEGVDFLAVGLEEVLGGQRENGAAVAVALAGVDCDLVGLEVDVLCAELCALEHSESCAV